MTRAGRARLGLAAAIALLATVAALALAARGSEPERPSGRGSDSWGALTPSPLERTEVGAARIGDRVYVVGGYIASGGTTGRLVRYDISEDRWTELRPLPIEVNHPGVTAAGGRLYVHGGNLPAGGQGEPKSRRLYRYDPAGKRWRRLPDAPTARAAHAFVAIGAKLYAAGGYSEHDFQLRKLEVYDTERRRWQRGPAMPTGRNHVGATVLGGRMVVTGGRPGAIAGGQTTVESYDPGRRRWTSLAPLATARSGHAAAVAAGRLVVFGGEELGEGGTTIEQVEVYDPTADAWGPLPEMVTPRHGLGAATRGVRLFTVEGGPQPGLAYSSALEYLDLGR